jgi:16S rRNA (guanine966-N2)-methyltransferase
MRVVAGTARGCRLEAPAGRDVRPTADRVREAVFNALGSLGVVEGADVVDLFAGTGALGIEALSRGARSCTFVERDRAARAVVDRNLTRTGLAGAAAVWGGPAERFVDRAAGEGRSFDLALLDPPYAYEGWPGLLAALPAAVAVIESDREPVLPDRWQVVRQKWYGTTLVAVVRAQAPPAPCAGRGEQASPSPTPPGPASPSHPA